MFVYAGPSVASADGRRPRRARPDGQVARRLCRTIGFLLVVVTAAAFGPAGRPELDQIERCHRLIALFDEIVHTRLDVRVLKVDLADLEEARRWRRRAEAHCDAGRFWFGVGLIEDAFREIGVSPRLGEPARAAPR